MTKLTQQYNNLIRSQRQLPTVIQLGLGFSATDFMLVSMSYWSKFSLKQKVMLPLIYTESISTTTHMNVSPTRPESFCPYFASHFKYSCLLFSYFIHSVILFPQMKDCKRNWIIFFGDTVRVFPCFCQYSTDGVHSSSASTRGVSARDHRWIGY